MRVLKHVIALEDTCTSSINM